MDLTKLKSFADDLVDLAKMMRSIFDRIENMVEKGENAGYQHFLLFPQCFQNTVLSLITTMFSKFQGFYSLGLCGKGFFQLHWTRMNHQHE